MGNSIDDTNRNEKLEDQNANQEMPSPGQTNLRPGGDVDDANSGKGEISAGKSPLDPTQGFTNARGNAPSETDDSGGVNTHESGSITTSDKTFGMGGVSNENEQ